MKHIAFLALATISLGLLLLVPGASAAKVISEPGKGAGQTRSPSGLAVDFETGRLYVADTANSRIDVFDSTGSFERAFGWGVKEGKSEFQVCTTGCREGLAGSGPGQFNHPTSITVDNDPASPAHHDVYVVDRNNSRVERFGPEGEFKLAFGSAGEGEGQFSDIGFHGIQVGVGPAGVVYVLDSVKAGSEFEYRLQKFEPSGVEIASQNFFKEQYPAGSLAVDSSGNFYVDGGADSVRKYDSGGGLIAEAGNVFEEEQTSCLPWRLTQKTISSSLPLEQEPQSALSSSIPPVTGCVASVTGRLSPLPPVWFLINRRAATST